VHLHLLLGFEKKKAVVECALDSAITVGCHCGGRWCPKSCCRQCRIKPRR
jgi:hypothetical protein